MELTTGNKDFYIYSNNFEGEKQGEILKSGTLAEIRNEVLSMVTASNLQILPVEVLEITGNPKPSNTVLLIEIEENKAYKILPSFGLIVRTNDRTWAGGLGRIIEKVESLINE
jgi:hypothetical protein